MGQVLVFGDVATGWFVIQEGERGEAVMEGERPGCPQPVTFPICQPTHPTPVSLPSMVTQAQQSMHPSLYNASNLWRSCTAIDSPAKCMVLCHVTATAYAKPVCVHNVCRQTA